MSVSKTEGMPQIILKFSVTVPSGQVSIGGLPPTNSVTRYPGGEGVLGTSGKPQALEGKKKKKNEKEIGDGGGVENWRIRKRKQKTVSGKWVAELRLLVRAGVGFAASVVLPGQAQAGGQWPVNSGLPAQWLTCSVVNWRQPPAPQGPQLPCKESDGIYTPSTVYESRVLYYCFPNKHGSVVDDEMFHL